ncbi:MAG: protein kinase family protein [Rhodobacteraceae bacterium]|nr:protein kinase family protein [Paracoccaceae bacterium]
MKIDLFLRKNDTFSIDSKVSSECGRTFEVEDLLDSGGNGAVHKCVESATGNEFAIKFLLNYDKHGKRVRRFDFEKQQLEKLQHGHIVGFEAQGSVQSKRKRNGRKGSKKVQFFVMELADSGNLMDLSLQPGPVPEEVYKAQFRGLSDGLRELHNINVVHRDIKPENVLISGDRWILADFGLCTSLAYTGHDLTGDENLGPRFWMSPEMSNRCLGVQSRFSKIGKTSDVFQLASVFWFIVNRRHPTGIIEERDWAGAKMLFPVLKRALEHCPKRRTFDGASFHSELCDALAV